MQLTLCVRRHGGPCFGACGTQLRGGPHCCRIHLQLPPLLVHLQRACLWPILNECRGHIRAQALPGLGRHESDIADNSVKQPGALHTTHMTLGSPVYCQRTASRRRADSSEFPHKQTCNAFGTSYTIAEPRISLVARPRGHEGAPTSAILSRTHLEQFSLAHMIFSRHQAGRTTVRPPSKQFQREADSGSPCRPDSAKRNANMRRAPLRVHGPKKGAWRSPLAHVRCGLHLTCGRHGHQACVGAEGPADEFTKQFPT